MTITYKVTTMLNKLFSFFLWEGHMGCWHGDFCYGHGAGYMYQRYFGFYVWGFACVCGCVTCELGELLQVVWWDEAMRWLP